MMKPRTTREQSHWAMFSVLGTLVLFGLYWFSQYPDPVSVPRYIPVVDFSSLQASAEAIEIPSFEEVL